MESRESAVRSQRPGVGIWGRGLELILLLTFASFCHATPQSTAPADGGMRIVVRVYDYAGVSRGTLAKAEEEASRIYDEAGVELAWLECATSQPEAEKHSACELPMGALPVDLRILPAYMAARMNSNRIELGRALPSSRTGSASAAWVFYERIGLLAESKVADRAQILGHALAHEIGHLLLGPDRHSSRGIMRAEWDRQHLEEASRGQLLFTPDQGRLIRSEVRARVAMPEASLSH